MSYPYDNYKGHYKIKGMSIPMMTYGAGSYKIPVVEVLQSGTPIDRAVFGLTFRTDELMQNLSDSPVFGDTGLYSENLKNNLSESVSITNS